MTSASTNKKLVTKAAKRHLPALQHRIQELDSTAYQRRRPLAWQEPSYVNAQSPHLGIFPNLAAS